MALKGRVRTNEWIRKHISSFHQDSIIHRVFGLDDGVKDMKESPAGMFFYNQRAVFFGGSCLFLIAFTVISPAFGADRKIYTTLSLLWFFWGAAVLITLQLHQRFKRRINRWTKSGLAKMPPLFGTYFLLDFCLVLSMIVIGKYYFNLNLDVFALLLMANTIVYSAY